MAIDLFYSYAREDENLRDELNTHLALLRKQGIIHTWYDREITPGSSTQQEIDKHLATARVILLLVSPDFLDSDYCYGRELQTAMQRHAAGDAVVIPVILRACDWESAPFGTLYALPQDARPVTMWPDRDAALTDVAKGIRVVVEGLARTSASAKIGRKRARPEDGMGEQTMQHTPVTIGTSALKTSISHYYKELEGYKGKAVSETSLRSAFQNLLAETARTVNWTLIPEQTIEGNIRPDGVLRDTFDLRRGYWEAKGPEGNLEQEIKKKIADGYPLTNTIFENTKRAVLYQSKKRVVEFDLQKPTEVSDLLKQFFSYTEPDIAHFEAAVREFKDRIPELAGALLSKIDEERKLNKKFIAAFDTFATLCRSALNPQISIAALNEMLIQHLLTKRLFRTVFGNAEFTSRNVIAAEIEKVIQALTSRSFNPDDFLKNLDRFYIAIEGAAKGIESWTERQSFLNTVYESFFQGFSVKQADTHGVVYTPQEIVDFMCNSVDEVLKKEFGRSISQPGVQILDPATGTGNFIVNLIRHHISRKDLKYKYHNDLFCNEIMLLPYYIASLNIEHEYYDKMGEYEPFEGICFADTLELAESRQLSLFVEENTERVQKEKDAQIMVVIGNPPYNVGQKSENDNNKNRKYPVIDQRVRETYAKDSKASNKNALSDAYVKFFRWASDRLQGHDGVVCLVTNNSFVDQIAFDGMRMHLLRDFTQVYHLDLHGNVRKNPKLSGTTHNVFGIQVGVGITIAVRTSQNPARRLCYYRVPEDWKKTNKFNFLRAQYSLAMIDWHELQPDKKHTWLIEGLRSEFSAFMPLGVKDAKAEKVIEVPAIFKNYGRGIATSRDNWAYDFAKDKLIEKIKKTIDIYNGEVDRWKRRDDNTIIIDDFVIYDDAKIKWSRDLKLDLQRNHYAAFSHVKLRRAQYRPFCKQWLFFDRILNEEVYQFPKFFPTPASELENIVICVTGIGADHQTFFAAHTLVDVKCGINGNSTVQCFPFYTYAEDGSNRRENITDWALKQFQERYEPEVTKWDIFHYVYGMLHHPQYRERYAENLKRDLPHIPLLCTREQFETCVRIGQQLMDLHLNYEQVQEWPSIEWLESKDVPFSYRVEKMRLSSDRRVVVVNDSLRLGPIPEECFQYRLGNRSALEWVLDQYQVSTDKRSGIVSDPNNLDDEEYIVRLVARVVTVSMETLRLVSELAQTVKYEDWLDEER